MSLTDVTFEAAMRAARFWLTDSENLQLVRHDSAPSPSASPAVWPPRFLPEQG